MTGEKGEEEEEVKPNWIDGGHLYLGWGMIPPTHAHMGE